MRIVITEEEKNRILGLHTSKGYKSTITEQSDEENLQIFDKNYFMNKKNGKITFGNYGVAKEIDGITIIDNNGQFYNNFSTDNRTRGFEDGNYDWNYNEKAFTGKMTSDENIAYQPGIEFKIPGNTEEVKGTMIF